ncbi:MAG: hypothetical protein ACREXJ_13450 [Gammaproteobacteria bacterium]
MRQMFASVGGLVYSTSDPRATQSTPGLSDLFVLFPGERLFLAWESKTGDERYRATDARRLTDEQREFGAYLNLGLRTTLGFGDAAAARDYLLRGMR